MDFKKINNKILKNNNNFFIISAKNGEGIKELKNFIYILANDILNEKIKKENESDKETSTGRQFKGATILCIEDIPEIEARRENNCKKSLKSIFAFFIS